MGDNILGFVSHVTRYVDGRIEIEFFDFEKNQVITFSNEKDGIPFDLLLALADSLSRNIWVKIEYENGKVASVSFEEYNFQKDVYKLKEKLDKVWNGYVERS